ncbi:MAG TPA: sulfotransferase family 2 domain-containing protein [Sphingomicrobium sp.]|nr:sulfotransferase family 2 domain-containing protein [Sphingomicrobium sp.]
MLVSRKRNFVFVHVQKTAGTSLQRVLREQSPDARLWHGRHGHASAAIADIGRSKWDRFFTFGFVRNPWDRLVSHYSMIREKIDALTPAQRQQARPFETQLWNYVLHFSDDFDSFLTNCTGLIYDRDCYKSFLFNQLDYLSDQQGELAVDFVGRFESFAADANEALRRIGIEAEVPSLNRSDHSHYRDYYTPRTRDLVAARFRRDIAAFGYEF